MKKVLIYSLVLLMFIFSISYAKEKKELPKIGIFKLKANGTRQSEADTVADTLGTYISSLGKYKVVTRTDIEGMLDYSQRKQLLECNDISCMIQVGSAIGVDFIITGSLGRIGRVYFLNLSLIDIDSASIINRVAVKVKGDLTKLADNLDKVAIRILTKPQKKHGATIHNIDSKKNNVDQNNRYGMQPVGVRPRFDNLWALISGGFGASYGSGLGLNLELGLNLLSIYGGIGAGKPIYFWNNSDTSSSLNVFFGAKLYTSTGSGIYLFGKVGKLMNATRLSFDYETTSAIYGPTFGIGLRKGIDSRYRWWLFIEAAVSIITESYLDNFFPGISIGIGYALNN